MQAFPNTKWGVREMDSWMMALVDDCEINDLFVKNLVMWTIPIKEIVGGVPRWITAHDEQGTAGIMAVYGDHNTSKVLKAFSQISQKFLAGSVCFVLDKRYSGGPVPFATRKEPGLIRIPKSCLLHCTVRANQITVHLIIDLTDQVAWVWNHSIIIKTEMESWSPSEIRTAIELCAKDLGYYELKPEQHQAITAFFNTARCVRFVTYGVQDDLLFRCPSWNVWPVERADESVCRCDVLMVNSVSELFLQWKQTRHDGHITCMVGHAVLATSV